MSYCKPCYTVDLRNFSIAKLTTASYNDAIYLKNCEGFYGEYSHKYFGREIHGRGKDYDSSYKIAGNTNYQNFKTIEKSVNENEIYCLRNNYIIYVYFNVSNEISIKNLVKQTISVSSTEQIVQFKGIGKSRMIILTTRGNVRTFQYQLDSSTLSLSELQLGSGGTDVTFSTIDIDRSLKYAVVGCKTRLILLGIGDDGKLKKLDEVALARGVVDVNFGVEKSGIKLITTFSIFLSGQKNEANIYFLKSEKLEHLKKIEIKCSQVRRLCRVDNKMLFADKKGAIYQLEF